MHSRSTMSLKFAAFSTDFDCYNPLSILRPVLVSDETDYILYVKSHTIEFQQTSWKTGINLKTILVEISDFVKDYSICSCADSIFIFFNLQSETSNSGLVKIINFIKSKFSYDKMSYDSKMNIIGFYTDEDKIITTYHENTILALVSACGIPSECFRLNINENIDVLNLYQDFVKEALARKYDITNFGMRNDAMSDSNCLLI